MKKWNNNLFKTLLFFVVSIFTFSLLVACNDEKTTSNPTGSPTTSQTSNPTSSPTTSQTSNPTSNPTTTTTTTTTVTVNMTESYRTNRANFKTVTGIELPALEKLVVDDYPYTAGDTSYCFDIISGDNLNYSTYQTFENFFKDKFGNCDSGYPTGDEATGRDAQWTNEGRWYQTYWDKTNNAIYINTDARSAENDQMTNTYKEGRNQFHDIVGIWLPKLDNIELLDSSAFSTTNQIACFDFLGNKNLFDSVLAQLKTIITEQPAREDSNGAYWEYIIQVNGKNRKINIEISYDPDNTAGTAIYINGIARDYYSVTLTAGTGGSATLKMGSHTYDNNVANVTAGDNLILTATPSANYSFTGWFIGTESLGTTNPYTYVAEKKDVTIQAVFSEPTSVTMTESYSQARTSFETATGLVLPELETVTAMFENLGSSHYMVDINGATSDTLSAVMSAFNTQTNTTSTLDSYNKNVYTYTRNVNNTIYGCELSCFLDSGIVVIMYQETQMTETYYLTRSIFKNATGVELPLIANLDAKIAYGSGYLSWDIVGGTNLTKATYDNIIVYLDGLTGWSGVDDTQDPAYLTKKYTNSTSGIAFQAVWDDDSPTGGIYLNVTGTGLLLTFDGFSEAKTILATRHDITIPTMTNLSVDFSYDVDSTSMTFDMTKASNFTESEYNQFVNALTTKLGNGTDASEENVKKKTTWTVNGLFWSVEWDLTDGIAINFSEAQNNA